MTGKIFRLIALGALVKTAMVVYASANNQPLATVTSVDLSRYTGVWYEIARLANRFGRGLPQILPPPIHNKAMEKSKSSTNARKIIIR